MQGISFGVVKRKPHCSPETWLVEPFDEDLDLWTLGSKYGFVWALMTGDADAPRCRSLPRSEGIAEIKEQLSVDPCHVVLAGNVMGDCVDVDLAHMTIPISRHETINARLFSDTLRRVCERLRDLQYYDGESRVDQFEHDGNHGGATMETIWTVLEIDFGR